MRIALVSDLNLDQWIGGGTLVNAYLKTLAEEHGWQVKELLVTRGGTQWDTFDHASVDAYFVTNIPHLRSDQILALAYSGRRYVVLRHDIASFCYLDEPTKHPAAPLIEALFVHSAANFFISPIQLQYYQRICRIPNVIVLPPPLDLRQFGSVQPAGSNGHLYLGEISASRGVLESLSLMLDDTDAEARDFYGQVQDNDLRQILLAAGASIYEPVPHAQVSQLLSRYRVFHYRPRIIDAFCLKVLEAELVGLKLSVRRENIGRFGFRDSASQIADFMRTQSGQAMLHYLQA